MPLARFAALRPKQAAGAAQRTTEGIFDLEPGLPADRLVGMQEKVGGAALTRSRYLSRD